MDVALMLHDRLETEYMRPFARSRYQPCSPTASPYIAEIGGYEAWLGLAVADDGSTLTPGSWAHFY